MGTTVQGEYEPSPAKWAADQVATYESSGGTKGNLMNGMPVVILTTRGRRTGKLRKSPLMRVEHEGTYAVIASKGGAEEHPEWYLNLVADSAVALQDGPAAVDMTARVAVGDERARWWSRAVAAFPTYDSYQRKASRQIPVVLVEPR